MPISLQISPPDVEARLRTLAQQFPAEVYRGMGQAGSAYRGRMRQVMRRGGGVHGVPRIAALSPISIALRKTRVVGGDLTQPHMIQMYNQGGRLVVGFLSAVQSYASSLQDPVNRETTADERHWLYLRLGSQESRAKTLQAEAASLKGEAKLRSQAARQAIRRRVLFAGLRSRRQQRMAEDLRSQAKLLTKESRDLRGTRSLVPRRYEKPARPILEPFAAANAGEFPRWVEGAVNKLIARKLLTMARKQGAVAVTGGAA